MKPSAHTLQLVESFGTLHVLQFLTHFLQVLSSVSKANPYLQVRQISLLLGSHDKQVEGHLIHLPSSVSAKLSKQLVHFLA